MSVLRVLPSVSGSQAGVNIFQKMRKKSGVLSIKLMKNVRKNAITSVANVFSVMNHIWRVVDISVCSALGKTKNFRRMGLYPSLHREKLVNHPMS